MKNPQLRARFLAHEIIYGVQTTDYVSGRMSYQVTSRRLCHSVLTVYDPDEDKLKTHTNSFYEELQQAPCQFIKYRMKILLIGLEVKLQTEDISKS